MYSIDKYMLKTRNERRAHLDLDSACFLLLKNQNTSGAACRAILALHLQTEMPEGSKVYACHACNNWQCVNVKHLYWGTPKDNHIDQVECGTYTSLMQRTIAKHGVDRWREFQKEANVRAVAVTRKPPKVKIKKSRKGIKMPRYWSRRPPKTTNFLP